MLCMAAAYQSKFVRYLPPKPGSKEIYKCSAMEMLLLPSASVEGHSDAETLQDKAKRKGQVFEITAHFGRGRALVTGWAMDPGPLSYAVQP